MILKIHSDAGYLNTDVAKSRVGGLFYLGNKPTDKDDTNGNILTNATIMKNIMASAAEAEYGALFLNARLSLPLRQILENLNHPQLPTPIFTDNATARGLAHETFLNNLDGKIKDIMELLYKSL